ncbi:MAG: hypothetical protein CL402_09415 [Acidiferrobacteraceae bacterium]|nr:hypothetical protein [Acidiferrobacteraceae bacterium]
MNWGDLGIGIALVFIIEGLLPFVSPSRYKNMLDIVSRTSQSRIRVGGAICMVFGVLLLYLI